MNNTFSSKLILPFSVVGVALVLVAGGIFLIGQTPEPQPTPVSIELVKNMEYYDAECDMRVRLYNGIFGQRDYSCKGETLPGFLLRIYNEQITFGDLTHDGKAEAVLILSVNYGGSGDFRKLVVAENQGGNAIVIASKNLGDRVIINTISIQNSHIVLDMLTHVPQDPACCPTKEEVIEYELVDNNKLERR